MSQPSGVVGLHSCVNGVIYFHHLFFGILSLFLVQVGVGDFVNGDNQKRFGAKRFLKSATVVDQS